MWPFSKKDSDYTKFEGRWKLGNTTQLLGGGTGIGSRLPCRGFSDKYQIGVETSERVTGSWVAKEFSDLRG